MKKAIKSFIAAAMLLFLIWFVVSWLEVVAKSLDVTPDYTDSNFFIVMRMGD